MTGLARARQYANRPLLLALSAATVWLGEDLPVVIGVAFLLLTLSPLLVPPMVSHRLAPFVSGAVARFGPLSAPGEASPDALRWRLPVGMLLFLALPISCLVHPRLATTGWILVGRLAWSIVLMVTLATWRGRWRNPPKAWWLGIEPRGALVLATGALMPFLIPATNERAGTVASFLPLALALGLRRPGPRGQGLHQPQQDDARPARGQESGRRLQADGLSVDRSWARLVALAALVLFVGALVEAGSRGGALAALGGCGTVLAVATPRAQRLRAGVWAATMTLVVAALLLTTPGGRDLVAAVLTDGSPRGVSWGVAASGRPAIWQRATLMIEDAPWTGFGLGTFGVTAAMLYPLPFAAGGALEDAHQFALQTWLDVGPLGLLALGLLVLRALRAAGTRALGAPGPEQSLATGLLGGLVAWTIFGLGDAVALGTPGNVTLWILLGMSFTLEVNRPSGEASRRSRALLALGGMVLAAFVLGWCAVVAAGGGPGSLGPGSLGPGSLGPGSLGPGSLGPGSLGPGVARNLASVGVVRSVLGGRPANQAMARIEAVATGSSIRASWLAGGLSGAVDQPGARTEQWRRLLRCDDRYLDVMAVAVPNDRSLAHTAIRAHPTSARAWRWWAETFGTPGRAPDSAPGAARAAGVSVRTVPRRTVPRRAARERAIVAWRRTLGLAPRQGVAWRRLGDLLAVEQQWGPALDAYAASCTHGDPGANGCVLAGALADHLGDARQAAAFLARSRWQPARARAERLAR